MKNIAFIDGQNLYMTIKRAEPPWEIDFIRFRHYLKKKYKVKIARYYIGVAQQGNNMLYSEISNAGFELRFRQHTHRMRGRKKGNVDSDIIFDVMKLFHSVPNDFVIVSGDGDYKDYLVQNNRLRKIIFPNVKRSSSMYRQIPPNLKADLSDVNVIEKIRKQN